MPIKLTADDYAMAYRILWEDPFDCIDDVQIPLHLLSPEKILIKKERFERLSKEAKEVIKFIIEAPDEVLEAIATPVKNRITKAGIRRIIRDYFESDFFTEMTIKEITKWVNQL